MSIVDMLIQAGFATSKSHARRLVLDKAIRINDELITDPNTRIAVVKNEDETFTMFKLEEKNDSRKIL